MIRGLTIKYKTPEGIVANIEVIRNENKYSMNGFSFETSQDTKNVRVAGNMLIEVADLLDKLNK